jgi:hypothetical protein
MNKIFNKLFTSLGLFCIGFLLLFFGLINFVLSLSIEYYWLSYIMIGTMFIGLIMIAYATVEGDL